MEDEKVVVEKCFGRLLLPLRNGGARDDRSFPVLSLFNAFTMVFEKVLGSISLVTTAAA